MGRPDPIGGMKPNRSRRSVTDKLKEEISNPVMMWQYEALKNFITFRKKKCVVLDHLLNRNSLITTVDPLVGKDPEVGHELWATHSSKIMKQ